MTFSAIESAFIFIVFLEVVGVVHCFAFIFDLFFSFSEVGGGIVEMLVGKIGYFDCGMVEMAVMAEM